jgi:hypothetical protein
MLEEGKYEIFTLAQRVETASLSKRRRPLIKTACLRTTKEMRGFKARVYPINLTLNHLSR